MIEDIAEPEFDTWGMGLSHMAQSAENTKLCPSCRGAGILGNGTLQVACPRCEMTGTVKK